MTLISIWLAGACLALLISTIVLALRLRAVMVESSNAFRNASSCIKKLENKAQERNVEVQTLQDKLDRAQGHIAEQDMKIRALRGERDQWKDDHYKTLNDIEGAGFASDSEKELPLRVVVNTTIAKLRKEIKNRDKANKELYDYRGELEERARGLRSELKTAKADYARLENAYNILLAEVKQKASAKK